MQPHSYATQRAQHASNPSPSGPFPRWSSVKLDHDSLNPPSFFAQAAPSRHSTEKFRSFPFPFALPLGGGMIH